MSVLKISLEGPSFTSLTLLPLITSLKARSRRKLKAWSFLGLKHLSEESRDCRFLGNRRRFQKNTASQRPLVNILDFWIQHCFVSSFLGDGNNFQFWRKGGMSSKIASKSYSEFLQEKEPWSSWVTLCEDEQRRLENVGENIYQVLENNILQTINLLMLSMGF